MKFTVEAALVSGGRLGRMSCVARNGTTVDMETPLCTLFNKGGSVPYLSQDMLKRVARVPVIASIPLGQFAEHQETVTAFGKGIGDFTALKDRLVFLTMHDSSKPVLTGKNDKTGIAVWGKGGKVKIDPVLYRQILKTFQPEFALALGDADTDGECARKRLGKAVNKTLDFLDDVLGTTGLQGDAAPLPQDSCSLFGSVLGGFSPQERKRSARETATRPVSGFLIEGFEKGHSGVDLFDQRNFTEALQASLAELPADKPRVMETVWSPLQVVKAFRQGIDIFSSAYPHTLTEKGCALVLNHNLPPTSTSPAPPEDTNIADDDSAQRNIIDLNEKRYFEDFSPVLSGCDCYTCKNFSRSYIHHLLNTSELLAYVLLTIHNFHRYFEFFASLREAVAENRVEELEQQLARQEVLSR